MSLWRMLDGGLSMPSVASARLRLTARAGLWLARRQRRFRAPDSALVHPEARVHPREGAIVLGRRCTIAPGAVVQGDVHVGDDCSVQAYAVLIGYGSDGGGRITLGDGVRIAPHAMLVAANHRFVPDEPIHRQGLDPAPITIGDDVWIAGRVTITAGVKVGAGSVLAAGAVVIHDVPPGSVVGGIPARVIRRR